jgi:transcriptional regulator with XRE-family HTH domain
MRLSREASQRIRHERARLGWSLRTASKKAKFSVSTWQRLEKGEEVEYNSLVKAVIALGWPSTVADDLMRGEEPQSARPLEPADEGDVDEVVEAILRSTKITADQRDLLIVAYRGAVLRTAQGRAGQVDGEQHDLA